MIQLILRRVPHGLQMPIMVMPELSYNKRDITIRIHTATKNIGEREIQNYSLFLHFTQDVAAVELVPNTGKALYDDQKKVNVHKIILQYN
jgi:hypothetical protein